MRMIRSPHHPLVRHLRNLRTDSAYRAQEKRVLLEGKNGITDVARHCTPYRLITREGVPILPHIGAEEHIVISEQVLKKITGVEHPEGIIAEFPLPEPRTLSGSRLLACDRIQDPGNLGTLIRTAFALGWDGIFLIDSCDPFNDKALRAAKGATFFLPFQKGSWEEMGAFARACKLRILISDTHGQVPEALPRDGSYLLVLGNESSGVRPRGALAHEVVAIPMAEGADSLNVAVAGGILMYALKRRDDA